LLSPLPDTTGALTRKSFSKETEKALPKVKHSTIAEQRRMCFMGGRVLFFSGKTAFHASFTNSS
jgi:hypothetical protein